MESLPSEVLAGLRQIASEEALPDKSFRAALRALVQEQAGQDGLDAARKAGVAALHIVLLDAVRSNAEASAVRHVLDECGWPESRAELVVGAFESLRERLRARLLLSGPALRQLVGVDWRVDYRIRSSAMGVVHQPVYIVTLKTVDETGTVSDAQFTCDPVQLETMLAKVQDAEKQVERAVAALGSA